MYGTEKRANPILRTLAAVLAAVMLMAAVPTASAAEKPAERYLVPVGHTVGVKLFAKGVLVV